MDEVYRKIANTFKLLRSVSNWKLFSPFQKLSTLTFVTLVVAFVWERWAVMIILIVCMVGLAYLTEKSLSMDTSSDPFAHCAQWLEKCRRLLEQNCQHVWSNDLASGTSELRSRSESIASAHIPDLELELESSTPDSSFQKKFRLELNSIVLLIIRDFVQFWYHRFSYNSQFLKDARQFLLRGLHNLVDRLSRLNPHQTSVKILRAYHHHLSTFQKAKKSIKQHKTVQKSSEKNLNRDVCNTRNANTSSNDNTNQTFTSSPKFRLHPALRNEESERRYLQSLTKVVLLCSCTKDVVSAPSAQLFLVEVLTLNVVLPTLDLLTDPDQLYEILIRLTYNESGAILNEKTVRELIDLEVKRQQLEDGAVELSHVGAEGGADSVDRQVEKTTQGSNDNCTQSKDLSSQDKDKDLCQRKDFDQTQTKDLTSSRKNSTNRKNSTHSQDSGQVFSDALTSENVSSSSQEQPCIKSCEVKSSSYDARNRRKSSSCDSISGSEGDDRRRGRTVTGASSSEGMTQGLQCGSTGEGRQAGVSSTPQSSPSVDTCPVSTTPPTEKGNTQQTDGSKAQVAGSDLDRVQYRKGQVTIENIPDESGTDASAECVAESACKPESVAEEGPGAVEETGTGSSNKSSVARDGTTYGDIVSTGLPLPLTLPRPKLQAFKDLFKSKKSRQEEKRVEKAEGNSAPDPTTTEKDPEGAKISAESNGKLVGEGTLVAQKLRALRLSPLLGRASKATTTTTTTDTAASSSSSGRAGESQSQTPSPLPTPSPSQLAKGGPLSFFRFRKPTLDFRRSSTSTDQKGEETSADQSPSATPVPDQHGGTLTSPALSVPQVCVTHESGDDTRHKGSPDVTATATPGPAPLPHVMSSYSDDVVPETREVPLFLQFGEEVEAGEETVGEEGEGMQPIDSSLIFQDISIPATATCQEYRSNSQYTLYLIEYEALHFSETGIPVLKTGTAKRRYREFVNLMSCLEDNSAYKRLLKDIKGPKRWLTLPFKNMDKDNVAGRQKALEQFLKSLVSVEAVCNGPEMREFLAYEGDSHIAFVRKAAEISVPRIDKMLARTVSGVFDKLKSLPSLPQEVISGIRGRDAAAERRDSCSLDLDTDSISVTTDFAPDMSLENMLREVSEQFVRDTHSHPPAAPLLSASPPPGAGGWSLAQQIAMETPRLEGDGAESPDVEHMEGVKVGHRRGSGQLCGVAVDLLTQLLGQHRHWLCRERVVTAATNIFGSTLDRWGREGVDGLVSEERCLYYVRLLRESVWPGGHLLTSSDCAKTEEELSATRSLAKRLLLNAVPGVVGGVVGEEEVESAIDVLLESLQSAKLNKHFLYTLIDTFMESLFPEIAEPAFQNRLLL